MQDLIDNLDSSDVIQINRLLAICSREISRRYDHTIDRLKAGHGAIAGYGYVVMIYI